MTRMSTIKVLRSVLLVISLNLPVEAQVISTAETSGNGKTTYIASLNTNRYQGVTGSGGYVWVGRGATDRLDVFTIDGWSTVSGATQFWVGVGSNFRFAQLAGWDMSLYQYATTPLNRRDEASTLLYDACWINSRHIGQVAAYVGINVVVPIGNTDQATFTPPRTEFNLPLGIAIPAGKAFLYLEADLGDITIYSVGVSLTR